MKTALFAQLTANDLGFMESRAKLLEVAAFLDRAERYRIDSDYRVQALNHALDIIRDGGSERTRRVLESLSDPGVEPLEAAAGKTATGAWDKTGA